MEKFLSVSEGKQLSDISLYLSFFLDVLVYWSRTDSSPRADRCREDGRIGRVQQSSSLSEYRVFGLTKKAIRGLEGLSGRFIDMTRSAVIRRAFV